MRYYDFALVNGGETIAAVLSVAPANLGAAWSWIAGLVTDANRPGCVVRITDEAGEVVVMVGLDATRRLGGYESSLTVKLESTDVYGTPVAARLH